MSPRRLGRIYGAMLRAYPRAFREEYGDAMQQLFRDGLRDHAGRPRSRFLRRIAVDWLITVTQERCSAMRSISIPTVRALMLCGVLLDLALLFFRFSCHDLVSPQCVEFVLDNVPPTS